MSFQILPNWCKKLGLGVFIVFAFLTARDAFVVGQAEAKLSKSIDVEYLIQNGIFTFHEYFGERWIRVFDILALTGLLIYLLSKEKIEDDYINKLRLESYYVTSILGIAISMILYMFSSQLKLTIDYFFVLFIFTYLIVFAIKKRIIE